MARYWVNQNSGDSEVNGPDSTEMGNVHSRVDHNKLNPGIVHYLVISWAETDEYTAVVSVK